MTLGRLNRCVEVAARWREPGGRHKESSSSAISRHTNIIIPELIEKDLEGREGLVGSQPSHNDVCSALHNSDSSGWHG